MQRERGKDGNPSAVKKGYGGSRKASDSACGALNSRELAGERTC
jgi:hypothetical protein